MLIEPFDIDAYATALARLMSEDELRKQIAANCREKVKRYDLEHVGAAWEQLLDRVTKK